ncbi:MAG: nucleotidyl transferase AbiEii/AbiGii toxin family protein [Planctomycetota bacterium]
MSRERGEDFQIVLTQYGIERLLYRLSKSPHADRFVLKGAILLSVWTEQRYRSTRDLDLLGQGDNSPEAVAAVIREICRQHVEEDGLTFDESSVHSAPIREEQEYEGIRTTLIARLGSVRIPLQVDIGFGDVIVPAEQNLSYPTLLDFPAPQLKAYPKESMIAEKLEAMVSLGAANSRMKDFYDLWILARTFDFQGEILKQAIAATFERRRTDLPDDIPYALTDDFVNDTTKQTQWRAFINRGKLLEEPPDFDETVERIRQFIVPPTQAASTGAPFSQQWHRGGPWQGTA